MTYLHLPAPRTQCKRQHSYHIPCSHDHDHDDDGGDDGDGNRESDGRHITAIAVASSSHGHALRALLLSGTPGT